ncbi:MAG TPA: rhamnan synthesis F family protein [Candidatus Saccharibacteria bacterium]|nr:rhamnan synthesis F family protein [Candidatus Saccharibacteria bacterium]HRQ07110.1 rhamnan synthesis F family protein [Candidatus Saccharibacteria bacterium]
MKRALLYVHFNKNNELSEYVIYQLREMGPLFSKVVFITNSQLLKKDKERLAGLYDNFIQRRNEGFDFGAWKDGIKKIGWSELSAYDSVTLMNDTCFGPIYPIEPVYRKMEGSKLDFWGATIHSGGSKGMPGTDGPVPRHLQSYFMVFNKQVVKSKEFQGFWNNVKNYRDVNLVIQNYETQLTQIIKGKYDSIIQYNNEMPDITYTNPKTLIQNKLPFIKVKAFLSSNDTLTPQGLINYLGLHTDMPIAIVTKHIRSLYNTKRRFRSVARRFRFRIKLAIKRVMDNGV